jgi:hypothetical protein
VKENAEYTTSEIFKKTLDISIADVSYPEEF